MELLRCGGCGLFFLDPLPHADLVAELYDDAYDGASASCFTKIDKKMQRSRRRIAWLARYAPTGRFLDIGCNGGLMVEAAREHGYEAHGLDVDPVSIRYAEQHYPQNT